MKITHRIVSAAGLIGLSLVLGQVAVADEATPEAVESTPSEIKDNDSLATQVDEFNDQNKDTVRKPDSSLNADEDSSIDPQTRDLANDVDNYNDDSDDGTHSPAIGTQPSNVNDAQSPDDRAAADRLKQDVRNYNRNGGSSDRGLDNGDD